MPLSTSRFSLDVAEPEQGARLSGLTTGDRAFVVATVEGFEPGDVIEDAVFTAKLAKADPDDAAGVIQKWLPSPDGTITEVVPGWFSLAFLLEPFDTTRLAVERFYDIRLWVRRGAAVYDRTVQAGRIVALEGVTSLSGDPEYSGAAVLYLPGAALEGMAYQINNLGPAALEQLGASLAGSAGQGHAGSLALVQAAGALLGSAGMALAGSLAAGQAGGAVVGSGLMGTPASGALAQQAAQLAAIAGALFVGVAGLGQSGAALAGSASSGFAGAGAAVQSAAAITAAVGVTTFGGSPVLVQLAAALAATGGVAFAGSAALTQAGAALAGSAGAAFSGSVALTQAGGALVAADPGVLILEAGGRLLLEGGGFLLLH